MLLMRALSLLQHWGDRTMTTPRHLMRAAFAFGLAFAILGTSASAQHPGPSPDSVASMLRSQNDPGVSSLSLERVERMLEPDYANDEPVRISGRLQILRSSYADGMIDSQVRVNWRDNRGAYIEGIKVNYEVWFRATAGAQSDTSTFVQVPRMGTSLVTNQAGIAHLRSRIPNPEAGLIPGEYYMKFIVGIVEQTEAVRARMISDPSIIDTPALAIVQEQEERDIKEEIELHRAQVERARQFGAPMPPALRERKVRSIEELRSAFRLAVLSGEELISPTQFKLFVGTKSVWLDDGTLGHIAELESLRDQATAARTRVQGLELDERNESDPAKKEAIRRQLVVARESVEIMQKRVAAKGGQITVEELQIKQRVERMRQTVMEDIFAFEDGLLNSYITLLQGDYSYWYWKASTLYGNNIWRAVKHGHLPWEDPNRKLTYGPDPNRPRAVTDLRTWRLHMIEQATTATNGDSKTWPENGYQGAANTVRRGGRYSASLLQLMIADINAFDPMKFLTKVEANEETGTVAGYTLIEDEWMLFEEQFRVEIGLSAVNPSTEWQPKALRSYNTAAGRTAISTGDRLRALDLSPIHGISPTRFHIAHQHASRVMEALAYMPMTYRYWIYTDIEKLTGGELQRRLGTAQMFPAPARRTPGAAANVYNSSRDAALDQLRRYRPTFGALMVIWAYTEGQNRNWPETDRTQRVETAKRTLAARGTRRAIVGDPNAGDAVNVDDGSESDASGG
jgi:hypothetical protein